MTTRVALLAMGGTIAMTDSSDRPGVTPTLSADDLADRIPGIGSGITLTAHTLCNVPGASLAIDDVLSLRDRIMQLSEDTDGFVISQGTDTLEETAFALDLLLQVPQPVVVTGAMRSPSLPSSDAAANLAGAIQVAAAPEAAELGVVVFMNGEIHAARHVRKEHTSSTAAFRSSAGPIGWVTEDRVSIVLRPSRRPDLHLGEVKTGPPVALLKLSLGDDGRMIRAVPDLGYAGLVVEALGAGHVASWLVTDLARVADKMPVVVVSRTGAGELLSQTYGFPGSEIDLRARGLIWGRSLDGPKARLLLTLLLGDGRPRDDIGMVFDPATHAMDGSEIT